MKKNDKNIREPYEPKDTPNPPQIIEPNSGRARENPVESKQRPQESPSQGSDKPSEKPHLLSEDADVEDETTV